MSKNDVKVPGMFELLSEKELDVIQTARESWKLAFGVDGCENEKTDTIETNVLMALTKSNPELSAYRVNIIQYVIGQNWNSKVTKATEDVVIVEDDTDDESENRNSPFEPGEDMSEEERIELGNSD